MNILYFTAYEVVPTKGGTERTTTTVATYLRAHGHKVYSAFTDGFEDASAPRAELDGASKVRRNNSDDVVLLLNQWNIDVIINQGDFHMHPTLRRAIDSAKPDTKLVFAHHFEPKWEMVHHQFCNIAKGIRLNKKGIANAAKLALFPIYHAKASKTLRARYADSLTLSNLTVLLSDSFENKYRDFARTEAGKIAHIHNALSFKDFATREEIDSKKAEVLVVSRLYEPQKKLSLLFKAWKNIEADSELSDWHLTIVGDGPDRHRYKKMASGMKRVTMAGRQASLPYYKRAAIFGMTSSSEGWGLTLTEAQQNGCVPVAMDSYSALHDIVTDGHTGLIVPYPDTTAFASALKRLMINEEMRRRMAAECVESSKKLKAEVIGAQWEALLAEL